MKQGKKGKFQLVCKRSVLYSLCLVGAVGCSHGGFDAGASPATDAISSFNESKIGFDEVATVPLLNKTVGASYIVRMSNTFDQKYYLGKIRIINPLTGKEDNSLATINSKLCSYISANGSCSLNVVPNLTKSGSFIIEASLIGEDKNLQVIRQIIRVSDKIVPNKGIAFKNDITKIITSDGKYGLSIPVTLTEDFDDVKVASGSLVCNGGFRKNSNCSWLLSGETLGDNTLLETRLTGYHKGKTVSSSSYTTLVSTAISSNLLLSQPTDIIINKEEGSEAEGAVTNRSILTIYNSGNYNATDIRSAIRLGSLRIVTGENTNCATLLAPHNSCNIEVEAFGQTNGNGSIQIGYRPHVDATALTNISANILYMISGEALPSISFENVAGGLENTARGTTSTLDIRISNNGWYNLTDLKFNLNPDDNANGSFVIAPTPDSEHPCSIDGAQGLVTLNHSEAATTSFCDVRISYTAPASNVSGNVALSIAGNYQESNGTAHSYLNTASYDYSAINSFSVLTISPIHAVNLSAPPAGEDSEEFLLSNVSSQNVILGELTFSSAIAGLTRATTIPDTVVCNNGSTIGGFKSCTVKMVYSPLIADTGKSTNFQIPVASIGGAAITDTTHIVPTSVVSATGAGGNAAISVNVAASGTGVTNNITAGANGTTTPYQFILSNGHFIDFTYTFTNAVGASPAMHFNVATSSLPVQAEIVDGTDCPVGSEIGNLAAGDSCNVVVRVPRASALAAGLITDAATTSVTLPYSWTGNNGVNTETNTANTRSAIIRTGWTNGLTTTAAGGFIDDGTGYEVRVNTSITGIAANSGVTYPIRVTPVFAGATDIVSCDITGTGTTPNACSSSFRLPASIPQGTYSVVVRLTAGTGATASIQQTTATLNVIRGMMFLSAPQALNFGGYAAADALCNADTNRPAGYRGLSYKAMLPARTDSIFVTGRDYYSNNNLNGTTPRKVATANNTQYLSTANLENAISSIANTFIAIGHYTGNATTTTGANCNDWTTNLATVNFVQGNVSQTTSIWRGAAAGNIVTCNGTTHRLLCVAQ